MVDYTWFLFTWWCLKQVVLVWISRSFLFWYTIWLSWWYHLQKIRPESSWYHLNWTKSRLWGSSPERSWRWNIEVRSSLPQRRSFRPVHNLVGKRICQHIFDICWDMAHFYLTNLPFQLLSDRYLPKTSNVSLIFLKVGRCAVRVPRFNLWR